MEVLRPSSGSSCYRDLLLGLLPVLSLILEQARSPQSKGGCTPAWPKFFLQGHKQASSRASPGPCHRGWERVAVGNLAATWGTTP